MHAAEDVQEQHNNQDQPEDPHASACSASQISVIATAAAECEHQDHNEQDQQHWESPSFFNSGLASVSRPGEHPMVDGLAGLALPDVLTAEARQGFGG